MTEKEFLDVFPHLKVDAELEALLGAVKVMKVAVNPQKDCLRVYIMSSQWIHKKHIYHLEEAIREQFFENANLRVKIIEKFRLSRQYTPENFMEVYRPSILLELKRYSMLEYNLFATADISFPEPETMELVMTDSVIAREKEGELIRLLEKIFCERCGFNLRVHPSFREAAESKVYKNSELRILEEARQILARSKVGRKAGFSGDFPEEGAAFPEGMSGADGMADAAFGMGNPEVPFLEDIPGGNAGMGQPGFPPQGGGDPAQASQGGAAAQAQGAGKGASGQTGNSQKNVGTKGQGGYKNGRGNFQKGRGKFQQGRYGDGPRPLKRSDNPDVIYGRDFDEDAIPIDSIAGEMGEVVIRGKVTSVEAREIRNEKTIYMFNVTDFTDTITVKMFLHNEQVPEIKGSIKAGAFLKLKGVTTIDKFDHEITIGSLAGIKKISDFTTHRMDNSPEKRVELHCHTKMSDMDGVTDASVLVKRAYQWGHPAIAITDHGVVQSFPEANHAYDDIVADYRKEYQKSHPDATKEEMKQVYPPFKVIYGCEAYLVDDVKGMVTNSKGQDLEQPYVVFDIETTGFSPAANRIIEIGAVRVEGGKIVSRFSEFVNPQVPIPFRIEQLTSINDSMVVDADTIEDVLPRFLEFSQGAVMVAHNAGFDMSFIMANCERLGLEREFTYVDTVGMARLLLPGLNRFKLDTVAKALNIPLLNHHRAVDDAACTAEIFVKFLAMCRDRDILDLDALNEAGKLSGDTIKKLPTYHAIILATSEEGRVNLYRLISKSHLDYYNRRPRIPKSVYLKHKEGLIIGSACEAGELYQALLRDEPEQEIARLVDFYDYLEIQPIGNNMFMVRDENRDDITSEEDLKNLNRRIVKLGEQFKKPVVATCDVHFIDPEDAIYREIIMTGKGFSDAGEQAPLYLRTTEEMLEEFSYLGAEKAEEVVITNPNKIAGLCDRVCPIRDGKFPPVIENSDGMLREICYNKAHEIYGEDLPEIVSSRLERELNSIISNGYAVMYIIAQKLVWKSNEDGYLVGSRGSVGSSLAATMAGITEVNPLSPHYYCEKCHYYDFDSPEVKKFAGMAGCDMPDATCPKCGAPLRKEGFDIPFETFLGFKGNKEPDIDLNFSGEYQSKAHKYTEVIFGAGQTFRAGTIGTLADKTAFGYVKNFYEERGVHKRNCEIDRIVQGCTGIRRTTGQHPGGIIVLPVGEDINSFTPVQHPANDVNTDIVTTHFDYHSIDANLLKLDILGHDDPTMIRMLEDLTGLDAQQIPLDNRAVMSLFKNTEALGITPEDIGGCKLGCLGVPEFGTDFAMQMLIDTKPQYFSDLVRIAGLAHGTDVWLGNAQTLIQEGKATISTAICTRDDIMIYLIGKGLESELSFTIMESVRKGKGLKPEWEEEMKAHDVPDWYIWSCKKIKYMFPKAHAAAYVMMAFRIAWFKIYHPLAYYAAYFSIRASAFSYELMCMGRDRLEYYLADYKKRADTLSKKEQDTLKDMRVVQEMYARGYEFTEVDLYKAQAHRFQIVDGKLMPALDTIEGLGDKAADAVVLAARDGAFLSKDDFRDRTKVSKSVIDFMDDLKLFGDIPESNQISLFDFQ
ncbi:MAG: PolC-type DNA polymerase III [Clostridiales bacterium]|nr:PolC-type DNA polymerase III [Clostridiales bacterium]